VALSTDDPVGTGTSGSGHPVKMKFFNVRIGSRSIAVLLLVLLLQELWIEIGRVDVKRIAGSIPQLLLQEEIVDRNAMVVPIVLDVSS